LLEGFGVGLSGSFGDPNHQGINAQRTALGQSQFVDYTKGFNGSSALITSNGATARLSPQGYWYAGPFGLLGEYITSSQHLSVASTTTGAVSGPNNNVNQNNKAYQIQASYVLTGEDNSFSGIKPLRNFDPLKGAWGAWQLAARWSELSMDNQTFRVLDPTQSASKASAWTVGANWFLNKNAIIRTDLEEGMFLGGAGYSTGSGATTKYFISNRPSELVFSTRFQLAF
jgi:phosphate-selective porin OprO/OprP